MKKLSQVVKEVREMAEEDSFARTVRVKRWFASLTDKDNYALRHTVFLMEEDQEVTPVELVLFQEFVEAVEQARWLRERLRSQVDGIKQTAARIEGGLTDGSTLNSLGEFQGSAVSADAYLMALTEVFRRVVSLAARIESVSPWRFAVTTPEGAEM